MLIYPIFLLAYLLIGVFALGSLIARRARFSAFLYALALAGFATLTPVVWFSGSARFNAFLLDLLFDEWLVEAFCQASLFAILAFLVLSTAIAILLNRLVFDYALELQTKPVIQARPMPNKPSYRPRVRPRLTLSLKTCRMNC